MFRVFSTVVGSAFVAFVWLRMDSCCTGSSTSDGGTVEGGSCGDSGESCCANAPYCVPWHLCDQALVPPTCNACGDPSGVCCGTNHDGGECRTVDGVEHVCDDSDAGLTTPPLRLCVPCWDGVVCRCSNRALCQIPPRCGAVGQSCCDGGVACEQALQCVGGRCVRCGVVGYQCCPGRACQAGFRCEDRPRGMVCVAACGQRGEPCCQGRCTIGNCVGGTCR